jgi:CPA2 family monovalent cation:H+ antiporter-2
LQTFVALYGSWMDQLAVRAAEEHALRIRRLVRWLCVDAIVVITIVIVASLQMDRVSRLAQERLQLSPGVSQLLIVAAAVALSSPFWIGMIRVARYLGFELAAAVFPNAISGAVDIAAAPRRLLVVTLQLAILVLVGFPLVAITQPFLPPLRGAIVLLGLLVLLAVPFWRGATNLQGHTRAAAQAIVESLAQQTREGRAAGASQNLEDVNRLLTGLGSPVPVQLEPLSPVVGKKLAEINLRGLTGATVLAIQRGENAILVPAGEERLLAGDVLALAGTKEAIEDARELLLAGVSQSNGTP